MKIMKLAGVVWLVFCLYNLFGVATGGLGAWYFRERPETPAIARPAR